MSTILGIDPGPLQTAAVLYATESSTPIVRYRLAGNDEMRRWLREQVRAFPAVQPVLEMVACYGMPVGQTVFETVVWIGRFSEVLESERRPPERCTRKEIVTALCGSARAKDSNVRQALIDMHPGNGGGATPAIGTREQPGPLYGMRKDLWSALAVAVAWDIRSREAIACAARRREVTT